MCEFGPSTAIAGVQSTHARGVGKRRAHRQSTRKKHNSLETSASPVLSPRCDSRPEAQLLRTIGFACPLGKVCSRMCRRKNTKNKKVQHKTKKPASPVLSARYMHSNIWREGSILCAPTPFYPFCHVPLCLFVSRCPFFLTCQKSVTAAAWSEHVGRRACRFAGRVAVTARLPVACSRLVALFGRCRKPVANQTV